MSRRRRRAGLNARLNDARTPVFLLDHRRQVVFFNAGCEELTGWKSGEVVGRVCEYASDAGSAEGETSASSGAGGGPLAALDGLELGPAESAERDELAALTGSLCPPPEVLAGKPQSVPAYLPHRDGRSLGRQIHFHPLLDAAGRVESVLGLIAALGQPGPRIEPTAAQRLHAELASLRAGLRRRFSLDSILCASQAMQRVLSQVHLARAVQTPIALEGEPGSGKEHVARVIHYTSADRSRPFVPLDCQAMSAIDLKLALRRLLGGREEPGEERGLTAPRGAMEPAALRAGTLYLANVEHLPRDLQEMVLTAFAGAAQPESTRSRDPASPQARSADSLPRLIVSTIRDLDGLLADETLRPDFYYLVTALRIALPPLRRRPEDLAPLAQSFLEALNRGAESQLGGFSDAVWARFREYNWPGNLDELSAVVREAHALAVAETGRAGEDRKEDGHGAEGASASHTQRTRPAPRVPVSAALILPDHLPFRFRAGLDAQAVGPRIEPRTVPLEPYLEQIERDHILATLEQVRYSKTRAADLLGMTRPRLYRRMQALGIEDRENARTSQDETLTAGDE